MYRRGRADGERGEVHPFYYQHYYPYRRGFDEARRKMRQPFPWQRRRLASSVIVPVLVLVALGGAWWLLPRLRTTGTVAQSLPTSPTTLLRLPTATSAPIFPTATPVSTTSEPALHPGGAATVVITGAALRGRREPNLKAPVVVSFRTGEQVTIEEGPVSADGYTWWRIKGAKGEGWSAQQSPDGVEWLQPAQT